MECRLAEARRLADDLPVFITSFLPDGTLTYVNRTLAEQTGARAEDLIGRNFLEMLGEEERLTLLARLAEITPESPMETHEQSHLGPGGATTICQWTNRAIFEGGRVTHYQAVGVDITEQTKAKRAVEESETNFRSFFESITDIVTVATRDGRLLTTNSAATRLLGYGAGELPGMKVVEMHPEPMWGEAAVILGELLRGERAACPLPLRRKDGGHLPVETRVWLGRRVCISCRSRSARQN